MKEDVNFEMYVKFLDIFYDRSFLLKIELIEGKPETLYWPQLFLLKYKAPRVYNFIVSDPNNECYLVSSIYAVLCYRVDQGLEGVNIDPLLKFGVQKIGGLTLDDLSCEKMKDKLLIYQSYMYNRDPSLRDKRFFSTFYAQMALAQ